MPAPLRRMRYWKTKIRRLRNGLKRTSPGKPAALLFVGVVILGAMTWGGMRLFGALARTGDFPDYFRVFLAEKIMFMIGMVLFAMIMLSAMITTLSQFFLAEDIPLLLSTPLPHGRLFRWKIMDTLISSTAMATLFALPVLLGYTAHFCRGPAGIPSIILVFSLFLGVAALSGITLGMLLPLFISIRRLQPALSVAGIFMISGVVILLRMAQPERLFGTGAIDDVIRYMRDFDITGASGTPFYWLSRAMGAASAGEWDRFFLAAGILVFMLAFTLCFLFLIRWRLYLPLLDKVRSSRRFSPSRRRGSFRRGFLHAFLRKEILFFIRSPDQWSQLIIIIAITIVFILNIRAIPGGPAGMGIVTAFLNMGMAAFVVAGLNSRFAFPSMPMEGDGVIHVLASPAPREALLRAKMLLYIPPQIVLGLGIYLAGFLILELDTFMFWTGLIYLLPALIFLSLLAFRYGLEVLPGPNESPENILLSRAGITFMLFSLGFIVFTLALFVHPIAVYYLRKVRGLAPPWGIVSAWYGGYGIAVFLLCVQTLRKCHNLWRQWGD